jgi:hypothetical protein
MKTLEEIEAISTPIDLSEFRRRDHSKSYKPPKQLPTIQKIPRSKEMEEVKTTRHRD